ncbi:MAG: hypothetical protein J0L82_16425 [Deltaproteobacteria bacterium]|nr:hypothetical protein [Deltaproteobacteria bacterium]
MLTSLGLTVAFVAVLLLAMQRKAAKNAPQVPPSIFEVTCEYPISFTYRKSPVKGLFLFLVSIGFFVGVVLLAISDSKNGFSNLIGMLFLAVFGAYFLMLSLNYLFLRYQIKMDQNMVKTSYQIPFPVISLGREWFNSFEASPQEYQGFRLQRSQLVDGNTFSMAIAHRVDERKDIILYHNDFQNEDHDPKVVKNFKYFQAQTGLPLISSNFDFS